MTQIIKNPYACSFGIGIKPIASSLRLQYWMATPRDGCEVESFHGGSIMITSNWRCPISSCVWASKSKSNLVTSPQIGTELSPTWDLASALFNKYTFFPFLFFKEFCFVEFYLSLYFTKKLPELTSVFRELIYDLIVVKNAWLLIIIIEASTLFDFSLPRWLFLDLLFLGWGRFLRHLIIFLVLFVFLFETWVYFLFFEWIHLSANYKIKKSQLPYPTMAPKQYIKTSASKYTALLEFRNKLYPNIIYKLISITKTLILIKF